MKLSIKFLSILALFVSLNLTAYAQKGDRSMTPEQRAEKMTARMTEKLELDANQSAQVKNLNLSLATKIQAIKKANEGDRAAMKPEIKKLRDQHKTDLKTVLTDAQLAKMAEWKKKKKGERKHKKGEGSKGK